MTDTSEAARLAALREYRILDTAPERAFDDLTMLASHICGTPIALITTAKKTYEQATPIRTRRVIHNAIREQNERKKQRR